MRSSTILLMVGLSTMTGAADPPTTAVTRRPVGISFSQRRDPGSPSNTLFVEFDDGSRKQLAENTSGTPLDAQISKDGRYVVFEEYNDTNGDGRITFADRSIAIVTTTDGSGKRQVLKNGSMFSFSPDGKSIAFRSENSGTGEVWIVDIENGLERQVTAEARWAGHVHWSPDGEWIAFYSSDGQGSYASVVKPNGSSFKRLSKPVGNGWGLQWTVNGDLVFLVEVDRGRKRPHSARPDGTGLKDITGSTVQYENRYRSGWPGENVGPLTER